MKECIGKTITQYSVMSIAGTEEERGLKLWRESLQCSAGVNQTEVSSYDLPFGMAMIRNCSWARHVPFSPTFGTVQSVNVADTPDETRDDCISEQPEVQTITNETLVSENGTENVAYNDFNDVDTKM